MPELTLSSEADLKKLAGWRIDAARLNHAINGLQLTISHPAASRPVELVIFPQVSFAISGNSVTANPALSLRTEDV